MDLFDELEATAKAFSLITSETIDDETTRRWQTLFGFSASEATREIEKFRTNLHRESFISDPHWAMVRGQKESEGFDKEAYEYSCCVKKCNPHRRGTITEG